MTGQRGSDFNCSQAALRGRVGARMHEGMVMFEVQRAVLGIRNRESVAADMDLTILTCLCVVAQDGRGAVTGIGCCTDEHADMLRSSLMAQAFHSRHRRGLLQLEAP